MHSFAFTARSSNAKTGPITVTTTSKDSCPTDCAFMGNGCYAEAGPLGMLWKKLSATNPDETFQNGRASIKALGWSDFLRKVKMIPHGSLWRHNQAGDLPGLGMTIDGDMLDQLIRANKGKRGWTYTHKPAFGANLAAIRKANQNGFTVNVSANSAAHAAKLKELHPDLPVVCVLPIEAEQERVITEGNTKILVCPATRPNSKITCAACGLCQRVNRKSVVGFPAHGASKKKAAAVAA